MYEEAGLFTEAAATSNNDFSAMKLVASSYCTNCLVRLLLLLLDTPPTPTPSIPPYPGPHSCCVPLEIDPSIPFASLRHPVIQCQGVCRLSCSQSECVAVGAVHFARDCEVLARRGHSSGSRYSPYSSSSGPQQVKGGAYIGKGKGGKGKGKGRGRGY
jgi:hypothetical protein